MASLISSRSAVSIKNFMSAPAMMARRAVAASITVPAPTHTLSPYLALTAAITSPALALV
jgi:hypothetical protein